MEYQRTIDEYHFEPREFARFERYIKDKQFRILEDPQPYNFEFTEASTIEDKQIEDDEKDEECGRVIDYPWGGIGTKGLHVFRGSRLEKVVQEFIVSQVTTSPAKNLK